MEQHRKAGLVQFVTKSQLSSPQICFTGELWRSKYYNRRVTCPLL